MEQWKTIKGFPNYAVSNYGRVKKIKATRSGYPAGTIMQEHLSFDNYSRVRLSKDGKGYSLTVHILVAEAFLGERPNFGSKKADIDHLDCNKQNNRFDNLQYVSRNVNLKRAVVNGLRKEIGGKIVKLNQEKADEIRARRSNGEKTVDIAKDYGISRQLVSAIMANRCWI